MSAIENFEELIQNSGLKPALFQYGWPTLDRPFGVALWPLFQEALKRGFNFDPDAFMYRFNSEIPMSQVSQVTLAIITYYIVIFGGRALLSSVRPIKFSFIFKLHNLLLTVLSGTLLLLLVEQLIPPVVRHGLFYGICSSRMWTNRIVFLYYLNYMTKFYELLDTVFLVFRKRPLTFLHTYHHGATALLCFNQLNGNTSVSWVPIVLNLGVHVVMYFYYFLSALGYRPWWKHWVTRFQIIQFILDLGFCYFASYTYFASQYWPWLPNMGDCSGEESAAVGGCLILTSYLFLFLSFYFKTYVTKRTSGSKAALVEDATPVRAAKATKTTKSTAAASGTEKRKTRSRKA